MQSAEQLAPLGAQMLSLGAWLALLLCTALVTWVFYKLTTQVGKNVAWLQGPVGSLTVKFGGPVALFLTLLWLGSAYVVVPGETLVRLEGVVTDVNGNPMKEVSIVSAQYSGKTDEHGRFAVTVPRSRNSQYDLVAYGVFDFMALNGVPVKDEKDVKIEGFPDPGNTVVIAKELIDQDGKPIDRVRVYVEPVARPTGPQYRAGGDVKIDIERRMYSVVLRDESDRIISASPHIILPGQRFELPKSTSVERSHP